MSLESIDTIPFEARASDVKMSTLRQHGSNYIMSSFNNVFGTFCGSLDHSDNNQGTVFSCPADILSIITNIEKLQLGIQITENICQVSLVRCIKDWPKYRSCSNLIFCIPPPIAFVKPPVDLTTLRVCWMHWFKIEVHMTWMMC